MTDEPVIMIIDDEESPRLTVNAQLSGIGKRVLMSDPREALEHLKTSPVDVIVLDMMMNLPMNGYRFLEAVRDIDKDVQIVMRTADDSSAARDAGIAAGVFAVVIKGKNSGRDDFRALVKRAIETTVSKRDVARKAVLGETTAEQLADTLGVIDDEVTASDVARSVIHELQDNLTAAILCAEEMEEEARVLKSERLQSLATRNHTVINRMVNEVKSFLSNPFISAHTDDADHGTANQAVDLLKKRFRADPLLITDNIDFHAVGLAEDQILSIAPQKLLSALRHLVEFCANHGQRDSKIDMTTSLTARAWSTTASVPAGGLRIQRTVLADGNPFVVFTVKAVLGDVPISSLKDSFRRPGKDPRKGDLFRFASVTFSQRCALTVFKGRDAATIFDIYVPVRP